jgi:ribosomal-protein-alanine N-acetyltransferase
MSTLKIINCKAEHIPAVVNIFCNAFADSIRFFAPDNPKITEALKDVFFLVWLSFKESFFVAVDDDDNVYGYIVVTDNIKRLWVDAVRSGFIFKVPIKWFGRKYGISLKRALKVLWNKICYIRFEASTTGSGQILSVAVDPLHHGRGYGKELVRTGIDHLKALGVKRVKLEVRPENVSAIKIYSRYGFKQIGKARDVQGEWLIMEQNTGAWHLTY